MKRALVLALLASLMVVAPVAAAPPAPGGTIAIADADLVYGGHVTFDVTAEPLRRGFYHTSVVCQQGGAVVYQWSSRDLDFVYPLIDQAGLEWDGAAADCSGSLVYRESHGKKHTILYLASVPFHVDGLG